MSDFGDIDRHYAKRTRNKEPEKHEWHHWFAWYPVPTGLGQAWLSTIERKYHTGFFEEWWEYRRIGSTKSGDRTVWTFY